MLRLPCRKLQTGRVKAPVSQDTIVEINRAAHSLVRAPPENAQCLVSADGGADTIILLQGLWLSARLVTPARRRGMTPMPREPHHRGFA